MKQEIFLSAQVLGEKLQVTALRAGRDWSVTVLGGSAPHVGSVSLAEHSGNGISLRTLLRESHKDQVVGDRFAQRLAEAAESTVCVACGIHYDGPTVRELEEIVDQANGLLDELCKRILAQREQVD